MLEKLIDWLTSKVQKWQTDYKLKILDKKTLKQHKKFTNKKHIERVRYAKKSPENLNKLIVYMKEENGVYEQIESVYKIHKEGKLIEKTRKLLLDTNYNGAKPLLEKEEEKLEIMRQQYNKEVKKSPATAEAGRTKKKNLKEMRINMINQQRIIKGLKDLAYGIERDKALVEIQQESYKPPASTRADIKQEIKAEAAAEEKRKKQEAAAEAKRLKEEEKKAKDKAKKDADRAKQKAREEKIKAKAKEKEEKLKKQHKQKLQQAKSKTKKATPKKSAAKGGASGQSK